MKENFIEKNIQKVLPDGLQGIANLFKKCKTNFPRSLRSNMKWPATEVCLLHIATRKYCACGKFSMRKLPSTTSHRHYQRYNKAKVDA